MGRGRGKGKKQSANSAREDAGSGEEEKIPTYRRRGRPQKPLKDEMQEEEEEEEAGWMEREEEDGENTQKSSVSNKDVKGQSAVENGKKRKKSSQIEKNADTIEEENGVGIKTRTDDSIRSVGFRQIGSRRKNKPRRAAEVGVGCN